MMIRGKIVVCFQMDVTNIYHDKIYGCYAKCEEKDAGRQAGWLSEGC